MKYSAAAAPSESVFLHPATNERTNERTSDRAADDAARLYILTVCITRRSTATQPWNAKDCFVQQINLI